MKAPVENQLQRLIARELMNVPLEKWGYYFPLLLAIWQYIEERYPGVLGELHATYDDEPQLSGEGAQWFGQAVMNDTHVVDVLDSIAYGVFDALPDAAKNRGFAIETDLSEIDATLLARLQSLIDASVRELGKE